jgi:tight adherence protein B
VTALLAFAAGAPVRTTGLLAFAAGALAAAAAVELARSAATPAVGATARLLRALAGSVDALLRLGREGREPGALERRRLLVAGALVAFAAGALVLGPLAGAAVALGAPTGVGRVLRARRLAYRRAVARDAPAIALAIADPLSGGHSLRGALSEAAAGLGGAGGAELRRVAAQLAAGATTETALESLRARTPSASLDAIVAAALLQRRSGGDLAALLRGLARAFEDQRRLEDEIRTATEQARFTGLLVVAMPLGGALLAELASPGFLAGLAGSPLTAWPAALALALQAAAALLIRRLGRARA